MNIIKVDFDGVYVTQCPILKDIKVGSIYCVGHPEFKNICKCKNYISHKEENYHYLQIMKKDIKIVSEVSCKITNVQFSINF